MNGFTIDNFTRVLDAIRDSQVPSCTVSEAIRGGNRLYWAPFVILRHDVDYSPSKSLQAAVLEADRGLKGTFYFHGPHRDRLHDVGVMRQIVGLGHEVGYHYETLDLCDGNYVKALELFDAHLTAFQSAGIHVTSVCAHGNPRKRRTGYDVNHDLFRERLQLLHDRDLFGDPYLCIENSKVTYMSDVGGRFAAAGNHVDNVVGRICDGIDHLYMLFHMGYWSHNRARALAVGGAGMLMRSLRVNHFVKRIFAK